MRLTGHPSARGVLGRLRSHPKRVVLREGRQRLAARAHGVAGAATVEGPTVVLDTRAPDARFDTRDLWVSPRK